MHVQAGTNARASLCIMFELSRTASPQVLYGNSVIAIAQLQDESGIIVSLDAASGAVHWQTGWNGVFRARYSCSKALSHEPRTLPVHYAMIMRSHTRAYSKSRTLADRYRYCASISIINADEDFLSLVGGANGIVAALAYSAVVGVNSTTGAIMWSYSITSDAAYNPLTLSNDGGSVFFSGYASEEIIVSRRISRACARV